MATKEDSGLFLPSSRPVVLPADEPPRGPRYLGPLVAILVVLGLAAAGLLHQEFWEDAGTDVTRLLPASTSMYVHAPRPWAALQDALVLDRWADREGLRLEGETRGVLADGLGGRILGVPFALLRKTLLGTDSLRVAAVPTSKGTAWLAFVEVIDPWARRRLLSQLAPELETVGRSFGHPIQAFRDRGAFTPWTERQAPLHVAVLDAQVVVCLGPVEALENVLEARVSGLSQSVLRRDGFRDEAALEGRGVYAWLDPTFLADGLAAVLHPLPRDPVRFRSAVLDLVRSVSLYATLAEGDDDVSLRIATHPPPASPSDEAADPHGEDFAGAPHTLLGRLPFDPSIVVSLSLRDPARALAAALGLLPLVARALDPGDPLHPIERIRARILSLPDAWDVVGSLSGEAVLAVPDLEAEGGGPAVVLLVGLRPGTPDDSVHDAAAFLLGDEFAHGVVFDEAEPLHVGQRRPAGAEPPFEVLWRRRGDVLVFAFDFDLLDPAFAPAVPGPGTSLPIRQAIRNLAPDAALLAVVDPALARGVLPRAADLLLDALRPGFRAALTAAVDGEGVLLRANAGVYSLAAAMSAVPRSRFDALLMADLPASCREAWLALCSGQEAGPLCEPSRPGWGALALRACDRQTLRLL